jgi:hypothetical protein
MSSRVLDDLVETTAHLVELPAEIFAQGSDPLVEPLELLEDQLLRFDGKAASHGSAKNRCFAGSTFTRSAAVAPVGSTHGHGFEPKKAGFAVRYSELGSVVGMLDGPQLTVRVT